MNKEIREDLRGESAYQIAQDNGFTGTQEEWLASLIGPQGPRGLDVYSVAQQTGYLGSKEEFIDDILSGRFADGEGEVIQGPQGEKGDKGDTGEQGPQGIQGEVGPQGPAGEQGPQGEVGPQGEKGDKGDPADFSDSDMETIISKVEEIVSGEIQGEQGPQGIQGETGPQGPAGNDGKDGSNGVDGKDGVNGLSAYEVAVGNGFEGTESEWLVSLKGVDGTNGVDGAQGEQGPIGETGPQGEQGIQGETGPAGADGKDGAGITIVAGYGITVDNTDPLNPIIYLSDEIKAILEGMSNSGSSTDDTENPSDGGDTSITITSDSVIPVSQNKEFLRIPIPEECKTGVIAMRLQGKAIGSKDEIEVGSPDTDISTTSEVNMDNLSDGQVASVALLIIRPEDLSRRDYMNVNFWYREEGYLDCCVTSVTYYKDNVNYHEEYTGDTLMDYTEHFKSFSFNQLVFIKEEVEYSII